MISTSTNETLKFVAPWRDQDPNAPVFSLRAGSVIERGQMEAELAGTYRAGRVYGYELQQAIRSGILALLVDDPEMDRLLELLDTEAAGEAADMSADDKRLLAEVRKTLSEHWPEYRDLVAQLERRREIAPIVALRRFCVNIAGAGITFKRGIDGMVSEATMSSIEPLEIAVAGNRAYGFQYATEAERFLALASPSDAAPPTSPREPRKVAGSSAKRRGSKTRA